MNHCLLFPRVPRILSHAVLLHRLLLQRGNGLKQWRCWHRCEGLWSVLWDICTLTKMSELQLISKDLHSESVAASGTVPRTPARCGGLRCSNACLWTWDQAAPSDSDRIHAACCGTAGKSGNHSESCIENHRKHEDQRKVGWCFVDLAQLYFDKATSRCSDLVRCD